jgi:hypothetical protein
MQRDPMGGPLFILEGKSRRPLPIDIDRCKRDDPLLPRHSIVISERERAFGELGIPLDAMKELLKRLHAGLPEMVKDYVIKADFPAASGTSSDILLC